MFDYRKCERCKVEYRPVREAQSYCSPRCRNLAKVQRFRRSGYTGASHTQIGEKRLHAVLAAPTASAPAPASRLRNGLINGIFADEAELAAYQRGLASDDYTLEYYEDGYPKLQRGERT
jgi:hypothetical protein